MNQPTKNKTAYYFYSKEIRKTPEIKEIKDKKEVNKFIRDKWKYLEDKSKWEKMADLDKARYKIDKENWENHLKSREVSEKMICKIGKIEIGLCCLNNTLKESKEKIFPNRTCVLKTALKKGKEYVKELALMNLKDVLRMLDWNYEYGISSYRLSSNMFPHATNENFDGGYSLDFADTLLKEIGEKANKFGIRLSMHPGHFNHIGAKSEKVFLNTIKDLSHHADILDRIEKDIDFGTKRGILCVHGGGTYGNKEDTMKRWISNFRSLPENVKSRICLENCEKSYSSEDCLRISAETGIPHIFDVHHYNCFNHYNTDEKQILPEKLIPIILNTWKERKLKPYFHISEQGIGPVGKHSEYIETIPEYLLAIKDEITLDCKQKEKKKPYFTCVKNMLFPSRLSKLILFR